MSLLLILRMVIIEDIKINKISNLKKFERGRPVEFFKNWLKLAKNRFLAQWTIDFFFIIKPLKTSIKQRFIKLGDD